MATLADLAESIIAGDVDKAKNITQSLVNEGKAPLEIINDGLIAGMNVVGARFKEGEMFVPEVLMSAKAMSAGMEIVKPLIAESDVPSIGKIVIGTVQGDLHDIGKNLVAMMMESAGFTVINLGTDIAPEKFVEAAKEHNADIVGLSALLTTTMPAMKETIEAFEEAGMRDKCKIIVGGAPVSQEFADQIGADGFAQDAASATALCKELLGKN